jgi:hypothetical protein
MPNGMSQMPEPPLERFWLRFAFPNVRFPPSLLRASIWCANKIEALIRRRDANQDRGTSLEWWSPLLTDRGVYLIPFLLNATPLIGKKLIRRMIVSGHDICRMIGSWQVFRRSFHDAQYAPLADALTGDGVTYRRLYASVASDAVVVDEYRHRAEAALCELFNDHDKQVRTQAADVFRNIRPDEFAGYRELANRYVASRAFGDDSWAFFHAVATAECKVDDIVTSATERLIEDIKLNGNAGGRRSTDLHQLQEIIREEYASSETDTDLRHRLLNLIDSMLQLELYGVDSIIQAHER